MFFFLMYISKATKITLTLTFPDSPGVRVCGSRGFVPSLHDCQLLQYSQHSRMFDRRYNTGYCHAGCFHYGARKGKDTTKPLPTFHFTLF